MFFTPIHSSIILEVLKFFKINKKNLGSGKMIFFDALAAGWVLDFSIAIR